MSDLKNVQPLSDFNWDEFENGSSANVSKQDLEKAYDETLNKIQEHLFLKSAQHHSFLK